jgi:ABC-type branched-subunit amino acid transport system ATPase component
VTDIAGNGAAAAVLSTTDLVAGYIPEADILKGVSVTLATDELVVIVGPNGAGKSTLIKALFGLVAVRSGQIALHGEDIVAERPHAITRRGMSYVPQVENVFASLTVEENLTLGALDRSRAAERIDAMYAFFPTLERRRSQRAGTMSGGERQMVALARALIPEPSVLLLDEPSAGLSPAMVDQVFERIGEIRSLGVSILMVEQNARRALAMADRGYVLDLGRNRFEGTGEELLGDSKVATLYLGGGGSDGESRGSAS